jgi:HSF-type DNA-binding
MKVTPNSLTEQGDLSFLHNNKQDMMTSDEKAQAKLPNTDSVVHIRLPFVHKLFLMLNDLEAKGYGHIISWLDDGKAFKIHDPSLFEASIQPQYFRQSRLASFIRQVSQVFFEWQNPVMSHVVTDSCCCRIPFLPAVLWLRLCQD